MTSKTIHRHKAQICHCQPNMITAAGALITVSNLEVAQSRLQSLEWASLTPKAVLVSYLFSTDPHVACRLPGGVDSPTKLWDLLIQGRSESSDIPRSRFDASGFASAGLEGGRSVVPSGGYFLDEDIREFDNDFFGINNLEAKYMDPEQRKLLEVVFECFESAGETIETVSGACVGCYVGNFTYDYLTIQNKDPDQLHRFSATGMSSSLLANRVSHTFNLVGPRCVASSPLPKISRV